MTLDELLSKFKKLQELSGNDKGVIEALQKKITLYKSELETVQQKYGALNRNYESISNYAASDKAEFSKLKSQKEHFEKEHLDLRKKNLDLVTKNKDLSSEVDTLRLQTADLKNKLDSKIREADRLKDE